MNHSIYSADRTTHLKIVVVGLLCPALVGAVGMFAHVSGIDLGTAPLVKAGPPAVMSGHFPAVR
jgi:predicted permease